MRLIVTEKPSVAQSIANALHITEKKYGCFKGENDIITWCVGHLIQLAPADFYNPADSKWMLQSLPILPQDWKYAVLPDTKKQYELVANLMNQKDVDTIICAADAGREGELIFRLVYENCKCNKPVKRLWISSMEESAIQKGFQALQDGSRYDNLYRAADCRSKADWLIGINGTRLFSLLYGKTINVGRVITPTLSLLVERESMIANFKKEKYYTIILDCGSFTARSEKQGSKKEANAIVESCIHKTATILAVEEKWKKEKPPKPFDLTALQRESNRIFGYTAQQSLDYLQSLYEKKHITYPRTDSRYITEDMLASLPPLVELASGIFSFMEGFTLPVNGEEIADNGKVTDHHALLPTLHMTN